MKKKKVTAGSRSVITWWSTIFREYDSSRRKSYPVNDLCISATVKAAPAVPAAPAPSNASCGASTACASRQLKPRNAEPVPPRRSAGCLGGVKQHIPWDFTQ